MGRLNGKVALVTGGARGQGRAIAERFAAEGADVVLCDVCTDEPLLEYPLATPADLEATRLAVEAAGGRCLARQVDVRDQAALDDLVAEARDTFGRVDIACANAGIVAFSSLWETSEEAWQAQLAVNLTGVWHTIKAVAPTMIEQASGCLVITASTNAREPGPTNGAYTTTKHGVIGLMRTAAFELGPYGIRANAILPGAVMTPMIDNDIVRPRFVGQPDASSADLLNATRNWTIIRGKGAALPEEIASAALYLASDEAASVTGIELTVDGGHSIIPGMNPNPTWLE